MRALLESVEWLWDDLEARVAKLERDSRPPPPKPRVEVIE
jgi:hypothetical protein